MAGQRDDALEPRGILLEGVRVQASRRASPGTTARRPTPGPDGRAHDTPLEKDWIAAARLLLIEGGIAAVQILPLAARLGVTRGGFYWRFRNRQHLLDELLLDWEATNTRRFLDTLDREGDPRDRYRDLVRLWVEERDFNPALDTAVRQWGTVDKAVAAQVRHADDIRIAAIERVFVDAGQDGNEAMVRARIVYFHQVGYYALGFNETAEERERLIPVYDRLLTGFERY